MSARTTGNLADLVHEAALATADKPALIFDRRSPPGGEFDALVSAAARGLRALGLQTGDRVAVHLGNTPDFPVVYFGALRAGLVALPVNPGYTADELTYVFADSGAAAVVTGSATADTVTAITTVPVIVTGSASLEELLADSTPVESVGGGEDLAVVLYTSGTSGRPKGAMLTHRALLANLEQSAQIDPPVVAHDDVVLLVLPLFHVFGLNAALGAVAWHGATGVLAERFDPVETLELLRRHGVTNVVGAPPMYVAWSMLPDVGDAFTSVRLALSGAAPLPAAVLHRFLDVTGHHVFEGYGLTETAPVLTTTLDERGGQARLDRAAGARGRAQAARRARQGPVEEGDPGEIVVRGRQPVLRLLAGRRGRPRRRRLVRHR